MNISTEELRELLIVLYRSDPKAYRAAKQQLSNFTKEIQKAKPYIELISNTASFSKQKSVSKRTVDRLQNYLKIIAAIHSVSINLPDSFSSPEFLRMTNTTQNNRIAPPETPAKGRNGLSVARIAHNGVSCVMTGCSRPRVAGSDYCEKHKSYEIPRRNGNKTCAYPSCCAKGGYAGTIYCQYHYQQEMYLSK